MINALRAQHNVSKDGPLKMWVEEEEAIKESFIVEICSELGFLKVERK